MRKIAIFSMCAAMALTMVGCATSGGAPAAKKGVSDEEGVKMALENWRAGMEGKDATKLSAGISDKFNHYEWGNKQQMLDFLKTQFEQGTLDGAKIDSANAKTKIEGGIATVYPVQLVTANISATIEFKLEKDADGIWRTTGINVEGV